MENLAIEQKEEVYIKSNLPSTAIFYDLVNFFSVFSDLTRVRMISALSIREMCVTDISRILGLNQTTVSHQLKILRDAGFVGYRRDGKMLFYRVVNKYINEIMFIGAAYLDSVK